MRRSHCCGFPQACVRCVRQCAKLIDLANLLSCNFPPNVDRYQVMQREHQRGGLSNLTRVA